MNVQPPEPPAESGSPLSPAAVERCCVVIAAVLIGIECLICVFLLFGAKDPDPDFMRGLTQWAASNFNPEREIPLYLAGCVVIVGLSVLFAHRWGAGRPEPNAGRVRETAVAVLLAALPSILWFNTVAWISYQFKDSAIQSVAYAAATLLSAGVQIALLWAARDPERNGRLYATVRGRRGEAEDGDASEERGESALARLLPFLRDALIAVLIFCLVFIPDTHRLAGLVYRGEGLHHWNYFVMGGAAGFEHGRALGKDFYSQYGAAWIVLCGLLSPAVPLSYSAVMKMLIGFGSVYWASVYLFLRYVARVPWGVALLTTGLALYVLLFTGLNNAPLIWVTPSSTPLRNPADLYVFALLWGFARSGKVWQWLAACVLVGAGVLFETDTGLYLILVTLLFLVLDCARRGRDGRPAARFVGLFLAGAGVFLLVFLGGLFVAGRGSLFQAEFWRGWIEPLVSHLSGMSFLLIQPGPDILIFAFIIAVYLSVIVTALLRLLRGRGAAEDAVLSALAGYGLCTLLIYVGRSHPANLSHPILPLFLLLGVLCTRPLQELWQRAGQSQRLGAAGTLAVVCLIVLGQNRTLNMYPGLLRQIAWGKNVPNIFEAYGFRLDAGDVVFTRDRTGAPDIIFPPDEAALTALYQAGVADMTRRARAGSRVVVVSNDDVTTYLAASIPPQGRYLPVLPLLIRYDDIRAYCDRLNGGAADTVYVVAPRFMEGPVTLKAGENVYTVRYPGLWPFTEETLQQVRAELRKSWDFQGEQGLWEVYQRRPVAPPAAPRP